MNNFVHKISLNDEQKWKGAIDVRKQILTLLVAILLVIAVAPLNALAATSESGTVTDNYGNRYYVLGLSSRSGKTATVQTQFEVTYYYGGTAEDVARVNGYTKTLTARGDVSLSGGGANSFGGTVSRTGANNSYKPSQTFIYNVTLVTGTHNFSCQGASWYRMTGM